MYLNRIMIGLLHFCLNYLYPSLRSATLPLYREPCFIPPARCSEVCFLSVYDPFSWQVIIRHRYQSLSGFQYWGYSLPPYAPTALSYFDYGLIVKEQFVLLEEPFHYDLRKKATSIPKMPKLEIIIYDCNH